MGCCSNFSLSAPSRELAVMFQSKPNMDKFVKGEAVDNMNQLITSKLFGGCIMQPVGEKDVGKRNKGNSL